MKLLYVIFTNALALFLVSRVLPGFEFTGGWIAPLIVAMVILILNLLVKPILKFLSFPFIFVTGGLFLILINAAILYLADYLVEVMDITGVDLQVDQPLTYVLAAIILGLANWLIHWLLKK